MPPFHARRPLGKHAAWRPARKKATAGADYIDELRLVGGAPVKTRTLGTTGYAVSELGFGGWGLGRDQWRGVEDSQAREALREAVDRGITFFDTALAYGNGHSERLIGEVLNADVRAGRVVVATKVPPRNEEWPGKAGKPVADVFPDRHLAASTEQSLRNLGVEALPLQQLHVWHDAWLDDPEWPASYDRIVRLKR